MGEKLGHDLLFHIDLSLITFRSYDKQVANHEAID